MLTLVARKRILKELQCSADGPAFGPEKHPLCLCIPYPTLLDACLDVVYATRVEFLTRLENAMAFQSVPDCAQATIVGSLNGVTINTTLTFAFSGGGYAQSDIDALAAQIDAWWGTENLPVQALAASYDQTQVRGLEFVSDLEAIDNTTAGVGGDSNNPMPALAAACISFRTGFTGRSSRGRNYFWGLSVANLAANENQIVSTTLNLLLTNYQMLPTYLSGTSWTHVVVSRQTLGAVRPTGVYLPVTTYIFTDNLWDTQRRRK